MLNNAPAAAPQSTNGIARHEWRDTTAAKVALLEPEKVEQRKVIARRLLAQQATTSEIMEATRAATGTGIGASTIARLREEMEAEAKRAARKAARDAAKPVAARSIKAPASPEAEWVRLPATADVVSSLVAAKVPFVFDGERVSLKGGAK